MTDDEKVLKILAELKEHQSGYWCLDPELDCTNNHRPYPKEEA